MPLNSYKLRVAAIALLAAAPAFAESHKTSAEDVDKEAVMENAESATGTPMKKPQGSANATAEADAEAGFDAEITADSQMETTADDSVADQAVIETAEELADTTAQADAIPSVQTMTVGDLLGMNVVSADDEIVGEIDYVVDNTEGTAAVIGIGGFLGLGEYTVAIDTNDFTVTEDNTLKLSAYTETELEALPEFDETGVESLPMDTPIELRY